MSPGRVVPNLVAGAIAEAGAQQAGDMMQVRSGCLWESSLQVAGGPVTASAC